MSFAPFNPPPADLPGKPVVPEWIPPATTKTEQEWAKLRTLDLSLVYSEDPEVKRNLTEVTKKAIREDGFLFVENYGVSLEQVHRQFAIGKYMFTNMSDEDKERLLFRPEERGTWEGYKHPYGFKRARGQADGYEQFNWYRPEWDDHSLTPTCVQPLMDEIEAFSEYLFSSVNRRILTLLSRVLELDDDYIWNNVQSKPGPSGEGYYRCSLYHPMPEKAAAGGKTHRMLGHNDFGMTTLLFSVPIHSLQIWATDDRWRTVPYKPGAIVINIGETLEILSGGHFKATRHRVVQPPSDQSHDERLSLVQFNSSIGHIRMTPVAESPLIQREGCIDSQGAYREFKRVTEQGRIIPTNRQWREIQIAEAPDPLDLIANSVGKDQLIVDGKLMTQREYHGVKVLLPV